jgi:hypothetical protein
MTIAPQERKNKECWFYNKKLVAYCSERETKWILQVLRRIERTTGHGSFSGGASRNCWWLCWQWCWHPQPETQSERCLDWKHVADACDSFCVLVLNDTLHVCAYIKKWARHDTGLHPNWTWTSWRFCESWPTARYVHPLAYPEACTLTFMTGMGSLAVLCTSCLLERRQRERLSRGFDITGEVAFKKSGKRRHSVGFDIAVETLLGNLRTIARHWQDG